MGKNVDKGIHSRSLSVYLKLRMSNYHFFLSNWTGENHFRNPTMNNLAQWFTPSVPICGPEYDPEKMEILADVPVKLKLTIKDGMKLIDMDCIKQNAQFVFHFCETICVEHVLEM